MIRDDSIPRTLGRRVRLSADIEDAAQAIMPFWPLESFVAANPLDGLRGEGFEGATSIASAAYGAACLPSESEFRDHFASGRISCAELEAAISGELGADGDFAAATGELLTSVEESDRFDRSASEWLDAITGSSLTEGIDDLVSKWSAAFFDRGEATWPMPNRESGFFAAWQKLAATAGEGSELGLRPRVIRRAVTELAPDPADAAAELLEHLGVPTADRVSYLRRLLCRRPGWPAAIKHRLRTHEQDAPRIDLTQYLAVVLFYEAVACTDLERRQGLRWQNCVQQVGAPPHGLLTQEQRLSIWQNAYERRSADELLAWLTGRPPERISKPVHAQAVFCIDPRSEGIRRQLEHQGEFETFGFAGFFGMPIRWTNVAGGAPVDLCPALITPRHTVRERFLPGTERAGSKRLESRSRRAFAVETFHSVKDDMSSKFALAEASGWFSGPAALLRTVAPGFPALVTRRDGNVLQTEPAVDDPQIHDPAGVADRPNTSHWGGLGLEDQISWAEVALRTMGLTRDFAPIVLLCGHGSTSANNPHASALDCGACGGNRGGENARVACALLNRRAVRKGLAARGITISDSTWFVAAEHDTTLDVVEVLDREQTPQSHRPSLGELEEALERACDARAARRALSLPGSLKGSSAAQSARKRAYDWAEVRPEWGLAGNYAMVVGPRELTREVDLEEHVFLHSYDAGEDESAVQLETILTAPMVVAHWINMQYFFGASAPGTFSAGSKILHNVVGRLGVLEGPSGDLRIGLPLQSMFARGERRHEPLRLLTVVEAPLARIDHVIDRNRILRELFDGCWVRIAAREPGATSWLVRDREGQWQEWLPAAIDSFAVISQTTEMETV